MHEQICNHCLSYMRHDELAGWFRCPACSFMKKKLNSMIKIQELNIHNYPTTPEIDTNLLILLERINKVRIAWGRPMIVTSGLRSQQQQDDLIAQGKSNAHTSKHLTGQAVDILDSDGSLGQWLLDNPNVLEDAQLWCESKDATRGWTHFQVVPPHSGNRWFKP